MVFRRGGRFIIALTYGRDSQWVRNVIAQGECELETRGGRLRLTQPHLIHDQRRQLVPVIVRAPLALLNVADFLEMSPG